MCWGALIAAGVQMGSEVIQGSKKAKAAEKQAKFTEAVARNNAIAARTAAREERKSGGKRADALARQVADLKGQQVAAFAASGLNVSTGSAANVLEGTELLGRIDLETINEGTFKKQRALNIQASEFERRGELAISTAREARKRADARLRGFFGGGLTGTLLGGKGGDRPFGKPLQGLGAAEDSFKLWTGQL